ncbi:hypothetical protein M8J77_025408 [Diaphorina citri]|nr:hypothetical protein M8J77_025408 [Diaphorina citri]
MGTREALFGINVLIQRCMDVNRDIYACFIDFSKAFDNVQHQKLIDILKSKNIDSHDIRIISNLYWNQTARIKVDDELSDEIKIMRGVRQGCLLSPLLFNIYSEAIFEEAILHAQMGIKINGQFVNNLRYADDTVILSGTLHHLQRTMQKVSQTCNKYGLKMNIKKTKFMIITKDQSDKFRDKKLTIDNTVVERVHTYKYLGTWINSNGDTSKEIKCRIEIARSTFIKMRKSFSNRDLPLELRTRMLRCYVFSTLLYGMEAWTMKKVDVNKINAFEMWCYRRILNIPWVDKVTNKEVLRRMDKERELMNIIKTRKLQYFGHVMRGEKYQLLHRIIQGKICGKKRRGRPRISWLQNLKDWFDYNSKQLFSAARNRHHIAMMISNLR